jgi:hypothetical protein
MFILIQILILFVIKSQILYYLREGYYNSASKAILNGLQTYSNDSILKFYNAVALILQDKNREAVRELESLRNREEVGLGSMLALVYAHKKFSSIGIYFSLTNYIF